MLATNETVTTLIRVREMIADEKNHCRFRLRNDEQTQFCVNGALIAIMPDVGDLSVTSAYQRLWEIAEHDYGYGWVPERVNDERPHAETLAMIDKAIEMELKK